MTEEEVRKKMEEGFDKVRPKVANMTNLILEAYEEGFNCCWELLTGHSFKQKE